MSYVSENKRTNPASMGAAILVNGSIILAVALSPLVVQPEGPRKPILGEAIALQPPPEPKVDKIKETPRIEPIFKPKPVIDTKLPPETGPTVTATETGTGTIFDGSGGDDVATEIIRELPKPPVPIFKVALRDPKFARDFQPDYPVGKLRLEIEGSVTVRVLVGTDGRVRQVKIVKSSDADFAKATEKQALRAWRFKPATRDGIPVEDWQTLTVRFDIN
jgi:periplasmic protein TonB